MPDQHIAVIGFGEFGKQELEAAAIAQRFDQPLKIADMLGPQLGRRPMASKVEAE